MHTWNAKEMRRILPMMPGPVLFVMSACNLEEINETGGNAIQSEYDGQYRGGVEQGVEAVPHEESHHD